MKPSSQLAPAKDGQVQVSAAETELVDMLPEDQQTLKQVLEGLSQDQSTLPCKLLYDQRGSQLFDMITETSDYYPTRTEIRILQEYGNQIIDCVEQPCQFIELGSGSSTKSPLLLQHLQEPSQYVGVDISHEHLAEAVGRIHQQFPQLNSIAVAADYHQPLNIPEHPGGVTHRVMWFAGSTLGNMTRSDAKQFLHRIAQSLGKGGMLILGTDLVKPTDVLLPAYNDSDGVTAAFNLNILNVLRETFDAELDVEAFEHQAIWNPQQSRIEMHLFAVERTSIEIDGESFVFEPGESICTEHSHKFTISQLDEIASDYEMINCWTDENQWYAVSVLRVA